MLVLTKSVGPKNSCWTFQGTSRPMRTNPLNKLVNKHPNNYRNKHLSKYLSRNLAQESPASPLRILIRIEKSNTNLRNHQLKPRCLRQDLITIQVHLPKERAIPAIQSPSPRRTIGARSPILKREDAFRIALLRENSVHSPLPKRIQDQTNAFAGDKAKDQKERQDREAENRAHASASYQTPEPRDMGTDDELSGLPWGSLSLKHVVSKGRAREEESRRGSRRDEDRSYYEAQEPAGEVYDERDGYYEEASAHYEGDDRVYWSGSGSGHGGSSR